MESWCLSKLKSWLLTFMMLLMFIVGSIQCVCIKDERNALLEIKASLRELSNFYHADNYLSTWVHHGIIGDECCDWERIKCDTTTGHITHLSLSNILSIEYNHDDIYNQIWSNKMWRLNVSPFLHFKELISLDLSWNSIDDTIVNTGLERLSSLKKLEILNLSSNYVEANIFSPLGEFTSLKVLNLSYINGHGNPPTHDIFELSTLGNLEVLDLNSCGYYGTLQMPGSIKVPILKKIKILNLGGNYFNESIITSISALSSLKALDLSSNPISGSFPSRDLSRLTNLEKLDLSSTWLYETPSIQGCKSLMRMKRLESINIAYNNFTKSIISCLSFLPFLKILDLSGSSQFGGSFPMQELSSLRELKKLDLMDCGLKSITLNGTMSNLEHLNLDENNFNDNIMRSMDAFPSLRFLSLQESNVGGRLFANEPPNLPHLEVLLLSNNNFRGILPIEGKAKM